MASPTQWTWVWVNSRSWWWTGRPVVLWFMGSQRVGHDWMTELNGTELNRLVVQWLRLSTFTAVGPVWSLIEELRFHKPCSMARKKEFCFNTCKNTFKKYILNIVKCDNILCYKADIKTYQTFVSCRLSSLIIVFLSQKCITASSLKKIQMFENFDHFHEIKYNIWT